MSLQTQAVDIQQRRTDGHLARIVDIGLGYLDRLGYPHAKAYLREHGVPAEVISRVLASNRVCRNPVDGQESL